MNIQEQLYLLTDQKDPVIGYVSAHPDDLIMHGLSAFDAKQAGIATHELALTQGERGVNYREPGEDEDDFDVAAGHRYQEGQATADILGVKSYTQHNFGDGQLLDRSVDPERSRQLFDTVSSWIVDHEVSILAVSRIGDHDDHTAAANIATIAAARLAAKQSIAVIELLPDARKDHSDFSVPASIEAVQAVVGAAAINRSQFHITHGIHTGLQGYESAAGWPIVGGYHVDGDTLRRLSPYPIRRNAPYRLRNTEQLKLL